VNRLVAVLVVLALVTTPLVGVAIGMQDDGNSTDPASNETATADTGDWSPPGPYTRDQLKQPGVHDPDAQPSIRLLGDPVRGGMGIRYKPAQPFNSEWQWLEPGDLVRTDRVQVKATAFGDATGDYELVIVYWEPATTEVQTEDGVVDRQVARDQTVQRVTITLEDGYTTQWVDLHSVFDGEKRVSMWLERDGEPVAGARWQYSHETNPLAKAPASPITSKYDQWEWGLITFIGPSVPGILFGRKLAKHFLSRTIIGTQRGIGFWLGLILVFTLIGLSVGWWQLAVIAAYLPQVAFLFITGVAFIGYLGFRDDDVETAEFNQKDIEDTTTVTGEEGKTARTEHILLRSIVRRDGKIWMPAKGIQPMLARYWAQPAEVDESELKTLNSTRGDVSKKFEIDPGADYVLKHKPARLSFDPQLTRALTTDELHEPAKEEDQLREMHPAVATVMSLPIAFKRFLKTINWRFVLTAGGGLLAGYSILNATLGLPYVGLLLGTLPGLIAGTKAKDGTLDFEEAPYHFSDARAILTHERKTYVEALTFEALEEKIVDNDMEVLERGLDLADTVREEYRKKFDRLTAVEDNSGTATATSGGQQSGGAVSDD
jgi:hypothetical protein